MPPKERKRTPTEKQLEAIAKARQVARANAEASGFEAQRRGANKRWEQQRARQSQGSQPPASARIRAVDETAPPAAAAPAPAEQTPGQPAGQPPEKPRRPTPASDLRALAGKILPKRRDPA